MRATSQSIASDAADSYAFAARPTLDGLVASYTYLFQGVGAVDLERRTPRRGVEALTVHRSARTKHEEKRPEVRVEMPDGPGLSDEDIKQLIESWIVPQRIRVFFLETIAKRPVQSNTEPDLVESDHSQKLAWTERSQ